ncbi:MAG: hypothetical protein ABII25_03845 [bacterium]
MKERTNEFRFEDIKSSEAGKFAEGFEIEKTAELESVVEGISGIKEAVDHDNPVTLEQVKKIEEAMDESMVDVGGEKIPIGELKDIPDLEENVKIWKEIREGNFENVGKISFLISEIARDVCKHEQESNDPILILNKLTKLSEGSAKALSKHKDDLQIISKIVRAQVGKYRRKRPWAGAAI